MTRKIYKSANGKTVDLGSLLLQNETVRAVGNMNVNARGDLLDSSNSVIESKNRQVQKQYKKQTNVVSAEAVPVATSNRAVREAQQPVVELPETETTSAEDQEKEPTIKDLAAQSGGLAAAIAKSRAVKQELEKPLNYRDPDQPIRRI